MSVRVPRARTSLAAKVMRYVFQFGTVWDHLDKLLEGAIATLWMSSLSMVFGLALGIACAFLRKSDLTPLRWAASAYVEIFQLMRELGIGFQEKLVPFVEPGQANPFAHFSPTGKVPCLVDGATTVWDSLAIAEYLAEAHATVWPADKAARAWARSAAAEMHSGFGALRETCSMNCGIRVRIGAFSAAVLKDVARVDALWTEGLARFGGPYLAGDRFTAVDAFYAPVAFRCQTYSPPLSATASQYAARLLALASMRDWYAAALREPWREIEHERETLKHGTLLEDLRTG